MVGVQRGHVFVTVKENRILLSLDAVPSAQQLSENQTHQLTSALFSISPPALQSGLSSNQLMAGKEKDPRDPREKPQANAAGSGSVSSSSSSAAAAGKDRKEAYPFVHRERERERTQRFVRQSDSLEGLLLSVHATHQIVGFQLFDKVTRGDGSAVQTFVLLRANSLLEIWQFNRLNYFWAKISEVKLVVKDITLGEATFFAPGDDTIIVTYAERYHSKEGASVCDIYVQVAEVRDNPHVTEVVVSEPEKVLVEAPAMTLISMKGGFAYFPRPRTLFASGASSPVHPTSADEMRSTLCYFWSPKTRVLFSLVWGAPYSEKAASQFIPVVQAAPGILGSSANSAGNAVQMRKHQLSPDLWRSPDTGDIGAAGSSKVFEPGSTQAKTAGTSRGGKNQSHQVHCVVVHSATRELLVLEECGDVVVCTLEGGSFAAKKFCHLELGPDQGKVVGFGLQRAHMNVFGSSHCWTHNLRSGEPIQKTVYPVINPSTFHVWHNHSVGGGNLGFWSTEGIWQLQSQRVTDFFSNPTPGTELSTEARLDDIFLARLWFEPFLSFFLSFLFTFFLSSSSSFVRILESNTPRLRLQGAEETPDQVFTRSGNECSGKAREWDGGVPSR